MESRLNHAAVFVSAVVFFLWGWVWYTLLFGRAYTSLLGKAPAAPSGMMTAFAVSFLLGWVVAYVVGIALRDTTNPNPARHGVEFGLFFGIGIYATMTLLQNVYEGGSYALWAIHAGYVVTGMAIMGAIVGAWRKKLEPAKA